MSNALVSESTVEAAALGSLDGISWTVAHGLDIAPDTPAAERADYGAANDWLAERGRPAAVRRPRRRVGTFPEFRTPAAWRDVLLPALVSGGTQGGECSTLLEAAR